MTKSVPRQQRKRRKLELSLAEETHVKLAKIAHKHYGDNKSAAIDALVAAAVLALAIVLFGCGGTDGSPIGGGTDPAPTSSAVVDKTPGDAGHGSAQDDAGVTPSTDDAGTDAAPCKPSTCADLPGLCGSVPDGCVGGAILTCTGGCPTGTSPPPPPVAEAGPTPEDPCTKLTSCMGCTYVGAYQANEGTQCVAAVSAHDTNHCADYLTVAQTSGFCKN